MLLSLTITDVANLATFTSFPLKTINVHGHLLDREDLSCFCDRFLYVFGEVNHTIKVNSYMFSIILSRDRYIIYIFTRNSPFGKGSLHLVLDMNKISILLSMISRIYSEWHLYYNVLSSGYRGYQILALFKCHFITITLSSKFRIVNIKIVRVNIKKGNKKFLFWDKVFLIIAVIT